MGASSEDEGELPPSLSAKKRRSLKRSRLSSDSDEDKIKTRSSRKRINSSSKETNEHKDCGSEQLNKTPSISQTPRSSDRLRRKSSQSFSLPSREKLLEDMSPKDKRRSSQQKIKSLKPRRLVNNFLRERSSYVSRGEGYYDSDDSGMSDFINDDDDDEEEEEDDDTESSTESDRSCDSKKKDSGVCSVRVNKEGLKKKRTVVSSDDDDDDGDDVPLSEVVNKKTSKQKVTSIADDPNSSDPDDRFTPKLKTGRKRRKVIQCSESDEDSQSAKQETQSKDLNDRSDESDNEMTKNSPCKSASLRPRSRRLQNLTQKQENKHKKMFSTLLKKRQKAKLDPKERHEKKQLSRDGDETSSSDFSSSEDDQDPLKEAAACFEQHSSELEEDDDDRDFIVDDGESSDEGMNSDGASQFLKLLDTFTGKQQDEGVHGEKNIPNDNEDTHFIKRRKRKKKKKERKASKWRRIKMEDDSEDSDVNDEASDMCNRHPPLHVAVLENDVPLVNKLIKEDPDCVYEIGYRKRTALQLAALEGKVEVVKLLLDHGADQTAVDCYHLPAIAYALDGHPECVQLLLNHSNIKNISRSMAKNLQEMNLLHFAIGETRDGLNCHDRAKCLELLFSKDKKFCTKLLGDSDARHFVPLLAAVFAGQHECVKVLLKMGADVLACKTDDGGNILHYAVECASHFKGTWEPTKDTSQCLKELLNRTKLLTDQPDDHGFTPLMYACESGNAECVKLLLENGASIKCVDSHGTTSLHLASMSGDTQCVQLLLNYGHQVDCVDRYGWPPLLYANFKAHESCVLALMKPKPEQVFVLGKLLRRARSELEKKRTVKVVKNVLVSLANHDAYYTVFNDFIRQNPEMLDENNYGLLQHIWRAILDFDNKRRWFLRKLSQIRASSWMHESLTLNIDRENVLGSAMNQMGKTFGHALRNRSLHVTFKDEPGICTGPKREFFACFCKDVIDPKHGLFIVTDDAQYSPVPNAYFAKFAKNKETLQDCSPNTVNQEDTPIKQEEHVSSECTDEELMSALSRTEELAATAPNTSHSDSSEQISEENQSVNSLPSDTQHASESYNTSQSSGEGGNLGRSVQEEDMAQAEESSETGFSAETGEQNSSSGSADHENIASVSEQQTWISCTASGEKAITNLSLRLKLKQLRFIGRMIGFAICQDLLLDLHLSKPLVKQILGIPLSHPDDLISFDYELHKNAVIWVQENSVNELDLPFSVDALNPWNSKPVTIDLTDDSEKKLTDDNKEEYIKLVSQFKLETSIKDEVAEFSGGLNEVIPRDLLSLFTADEFSLLIGGVSKLDVNDWKKHTVYEGFSPEHDVIHWFWNVVSQLKEEEKALLMKFSTGSPCVPLGGFAALTGLSGPTKFTILKIAGLNKIPMASTCFNMLKLTSYSSEKHLKDKLLIAIRHGAEGFSFA
ncbi:uncharacterized protein LOC144636654 isoform X2 [Oculina patagonica]